MSGKAPWRRLPDALADHLRLFVGYRAGAGIRAVQVESCDDRANENEANRPLRPHAAPPQFSAETKNKVTIAIDVEADWSHAPGISSPSKCSAFWADSGVSAEFAEYDGLVDLSRYWVTGLHSPLGVSLRGRFGAR